MAKCARESHVLGRLGSSPSGIVWPAFIAPKTDVPRRLRIILEDLQGVSSDQPVVFPVHPRTRRHLAQQNWDKSAANGALLITAPVGYLDMVMLEKNAEIIVTDSGGVQKEVLFHQVPCVTVRDNTVRVETVEFGWSGTFHRLVCRLARDCSQLMLAFTLLRSIHLPEFKEGRLLRMRRRAQRGGQRRTTSCSEMATCRA